jgi:TolB protein
MPVAKPAFVRRGRALQSGQTAELSIVDGTTGAVRVVFEADEVIEAPNWTPDGLTLVFNAGGELWRVAVDGKSRPEIIDTGKVRDLNNDHLLSPDGKTAYLSADDGHLYSVAISGGEPRRISNHHPEPHHYYLHGISPDGQTLAYVAVEGQLGQKRVNIFTIPATGGPDARLSNVSYPNDGPEYSPDGKWIYFSGERAAKIPGHAQCFRMRPDGTGIEQLTFDERVNWFPHLSPDGRLVTFISYPPGTIGHPPDKHVILRVMGADGSGQRDLVALFGGQGTMNVNSWAPDSRRFAFVAYPLSR